MWQDLIVQVGEVHYPVQRSAAFDADWGIGHEPALRWYSRACSASGKLTGHQPGGAPDYDPRRKTLFTRKAYLEWAYGGDRGATTTGCYFSPNLFYRWRNKANLSGFCANWLEIDTKGHSRLTEQQALAVLGQVANALEHARLPSPTAWVLTGSGGIHIYWRYANPVMTVSREHRAELLDYWRQVNERLVTALEASRGVFGYTEWSVDKSASNNPAGVMRLPGSVHGSTGRGVRYLNGGPVHELAQLGNRLGVRTLPLSTVPARPREEGPAKVRPAPARRSFIKVAPVAQREREPGVAQGYDNPAQRQLLATVVQRWCEHLEATGPVAKGQRDLTVFHLYNCARRIWSAEAAWDFIRDVNQRFVQLPVRLLEAYLSTAVTRVYYYAIPRLRAILCGQLGLPFCDIFLARRRRLSADEIALRQAAAGRSTSRSRRSRALEQIVDAARRLSWRSLSGVYSLEVSQIWPALGVSRATAYRYWTEVCRKLAPFSQLSLTTLFSGSVRLKRSTPPYNASGAGRSKSSSAVGALASQGAGECSGVRNCTQLTLFGGTAGNPECEPVGSTALGQQCWSPPAAG